MLVFGPVPSRRLGFSLGVNHIPPKNCTYACVYCQVGRTRNMSIERREFYPVDQILKEAEAKIRECEEKKQPLDYITLVPDGEPTLDINLGKLIAALKTFNFPIAVISNASLINRLDVQEELLQADWVSCKVDAIDETTWRKINRPNRKLSLEKIFSGMLSFRQNFKGQFVTETMLVEGLNHDNSHLGELAVFLGELQPKKAYFSIPTRPPCESWVRPPGAQTLSEVIEWANRSLAFAAFLFGYETPDFIATGNPAEDILSITAVHPMYQKALETLLEKANADQSVMAKLLDTGQIKQVKYQDEIFYVRAYTG